MQPRLFIYAWGKKGVIRPLPCSPFQLRPAPPGSQLAGRPAGGSGFRCLHLFCQHMPRRRGLRIVRDDVSFSKQTSSLIHSVAPPLQTATASLGCGLGTALRVAFSYQILHLFYLHRRESKDMTYGHVLLFGFRRPEGGSTLRYFNARGRQSRPCAIPGRRPGIYAPLGARPRRAVGWYFGS